MAELTLVEAVNDCLHTELARDGSVLVMGEDVGRAGGVFRATAGLLDRFGPDRCIDTPLAEAGILGTAVGLCMAGWRPVCEMQYDAFSYPCLDQLINHVGRYRWRTRGEMEFPITLRMPYGGGVRAPELHDDSPETYYVHTPGVKVAIPSTPADAKGLLAAAIRDPDPVVVLEPKFVYRTARGEVPEGEHVVPLGTMRVAREGTDLTIVAYGAMVTVAESAADTLGASVEVLDVRSLKPLDEETLLASVAKTGRVVIVQEAPRVAGFGAELAAVIAEKAILDLRGPVLRVTGFDVPYPYWQIEDAYVPSVERVVGRRPAPAGRVLVMAYEFKLPDLGEGLTEGEIARWLVAEGQEVAEDDPLVEIQTDKTTVEIPSPAAGKVARILVAEGQVVPVGTVLVVIGDSPDEVAPSAHDFVRDDRRSEPACRAGRHAGGEAAGNPAGSTRSRSELGVDLDVGCRYRSERACDRGGCSVRLRVRTAAEAGRAAGAAARCPATDRRAHGARPPRGPPGDVGRGVRLRGGRPEAPRPDGAEGLRALAPGVPGAERPARGGRDRLLRAIRHRRRRPDRAGPGRPGRPRLRSRHARGARRRRRRASPAPRGPARSSPTSCAGSTFTVTSAGKLAGLFHTPIVNHPEVAILGVGRIAPRRSSATVRSSSARTGTIAVTFDHRVVDGARAAEFGLAVIAPTRRTDA